MESDYQRKYQSYTFKGKHDDENIILVLRRHWLVAVFHFLPAVFFIVGVIIFHFIFGQTEDIFGLVLDEYAVRIIETGFFMLAWLVIFVIWIDYYLDVWIITDERIVNIEQFALFRREVSELKHNKIQDITTEVHGILPTLFQFGYVFVQTAGGKARFVFKQVPDPVRVRKIIMELQKHALLEEKREEGAILRGKV